MWLVNDRWAGGGGHGRTYERPHERKKDDECGEWTKVTSLKKKQLNNEAWWRSLMLCYTHKTHWQVCVFVLHSKTIIQVILKFISSVVRICEQQQLRSSCAASLHWAPRNKGSGAAPARDQSQNQLCIRLVTLAFSDFCLGVYTLVFGGLSVCFIQTENSSTFGIHSNVYVKRQKRPSLKHFWLFRHKCVYF